MKSLIIFLSIILCSCVTQNVQKYGSVDNTVKTITVPPGSEGLKGKIKNYLSSNGWKMVVTRGPTVVEGKAGQDVDLKEYDTFNTRYLLKIEASVVDLCFSFEKLYNYDLSMIDNKTGEEIFTMSGNACESDIVEKFATTLNYQK